jgi:hypothetical protein
VIALVLFGFAVLVAANALTAHAAMARRLAVHGDLLRSGEIILESVRAGQLPLETGPVEVTEDLRTPGSVDVSASVRVVSRPQAGLTQVTVRVWYDSRGVRQETSLTSMVWRP